MGFFVMRNILKVVFVIIGTLIGAGFASGQEMYLFFFSYGMKGLIGIVVSCTLMGLIIYKSLCLIDKYNIRTYKEFLEMFIRPKENESFFNLKNIVNTVINIFILVTFFIMIAGFGAYFEQELGIGSLVGSVVLASLCFLIFMTSIKGVVKANEILVPILIMFVVVIGIMNIVKINLPELDNYVVRTNFSSYLLSAILYCSYNSILLLPVLITLKDYLRDKKQIGAIAGISTVISIVLSFVIFLLLVRVDVDIANLEMPAVYVVSHMFKFLRLAYGFIILGSIFTTAISLGASFLQNVCKSKRSYTQVAFFMCITSVLVSNFGFSNLINSLYPVFGYLGIVQILSLLCKKT